MSSQQSHQLQLQRDIILEKKAELRVLNNRMNELGNALKNQNSQSVVQKESLTEGDNQQLLFNGNYLQDTLNRKRSVGQKPVIQDINANIVSPENESSKNKLNQVLNVFTSTSVDQILKTKNSLLDTPSSSSSSLSSLSLPVVSLDEFKKNLSTFKGPKPLPPLRTTPVTVIERNESPINAVKSNEELIALIRQDAKKMDNFNEDSNSIKRSTNMSYTDLSLSVDSDKIVIKQQAKDENGSISSTLEAKPEIKSKPVIAAKPTLSVKPMMEINNKQEKVDNYDKPYIERPPSDMYVPDYNKDIVIPDPDYPNEGPSEPDAFELSFADIDEINEIQTDLWSGTSISQSPYDSESDDLENLTVPVIISIPPEKMPPPILMKPDKPRKPKRKLVLDPFALLLDSALEGELSLVKEILNQVCSFTYPKEIFFFFFLFL